MLIKNKHPIFCSVTFFLLMLSIVSCVSPIQRNEQYLNNSFLAAFTDYHKSFANYNKWRESLHKSLHTYGDETFSQILESQPIDVQYAIMNTMGYDDIVIYQNYPKTDSVLSAIPKH